MADRLKRIADAFKSVLLYILTPLLLVAMGFYYLFDKYRTVKDELQAKDGEEKLNELFGEQEQVDNTALNASDYYQKLRTAYLSGNHQSGGSRASGEGQTDSSTGSGIKPGGGDAKN